MCGSKGYTFLAVLVWNRVRYVHSELELGTVLRRSCLVINFLPLRGEIILIIVMKFNSVMGLVCNRVWNFEPGLK